MKYIRKISLPALLRYNFGDQSEAVRQDVKARGRCDVRYIRSTTGRRYAKANRRPVAFKRGGAICLQIAPPSFFIVNVS